MKLTDLATRKIPPTPWPDGDAIPWHDPILSQRLLQAHIKMEANPATSRIPHVQRQVTWIHNKLLQGRPLRVLNLGCGPGIYTTHLAQRGHSCVGIDASPAAVDYAREQARANSLDCTYEQGYLQQTEFGSGFGLALLVFGEFNVYKPADIQTMLTKIYQALTTDSFLLLEVHTYLYIRRMGRRASNWTVYPHGLFGDAPYLYLQEYFWDRPSRTTTTRFYTIPLSDGHVSRYVQTFQAYTNTECQDMLEGAGFTDVTFYPSLGGSSGKRHDGLLWVSARKV